MKSVLAVLSFLVLNNVWATTPEYIELAEFPRLEVTASAGLALQSGYLTRQDSVGSYGVGLNIGLPGGIFAFDWQGFRADHDTGEFALNNNKPVTVSVFTFTPYFRAYNKDAFSVLLGVGFAQVGLYQTDPEYTISYGTFVYSALLRYQLSSKWALQYKTSWLSVSQTANDQKTGFEIWNHALGAGYSFN
jgi:hypothetical protein